MVHPPELNEEDLDLLVTYEIDENESVNAAIVNTFMALDIGAFDRDTTLQSQVDTDALDGFDWQSGRHLYVSVEIWGRQVVVTPERVRIYADTPEA